MVPCFFESRGTSPESLLFLTTGGLLDGGLSFAVMDPLLDSGSFIVLFFAFADRDLDFHETLLEIHTERHDRDPFAPRLPH